MNQSSSAGDDLFCTAKAEAIAIEEIPRVPGLISHRVEINKWVILADGVRSGQRTANSQVVARVIRRQGEDPREFLSGLLEFSQ